MAAEGNSRVDLIRTLNKLQDTFSAIGGETVDLPQIVVVCVCSTDTRLLGSLAG